MATSSDDAARERMVRNQLERRGIHDERVLAACARVPRERFVPFPFRSQAYEDHPLPIGHGQTISQPYIVALMTQTLAVTDHDRVLEIGTGSGYQTAVLAELTGRVYTIEWDRALSARALRRLHRLGYRNIEGRVGDGGEGWAEASPFESIVVTAASAAVPDPLIAQLRVGGRLVLPLGDAHEQALVVLIKQRDQVVRQSLCGCLFVPLRGRFGVTNAGAAQ